MTEIKNVRSTIKPEPMVMDEYSVYINENIREIEVSYDTEDTEHTEYEFDQTIYLQREYIALLAEKNDEQQRQLAEQTQQLSDTQLALCELYEASLQA